jgi:ketosteroid isomerase-like protein
VQRSNADLVRTVLDVYDRDGFEAALAYADPDVEIKMVGGINDGEHRGLEQGLAFTSDWEEAWENASYLIAELEEVDHETVLARIETELRGAGSGMNVAFTQWWVFGVRDGRFVRWHIYYDRDRAFEAARG